MDSGAKRNGLSEADFYILSEFGEKRLEGRLEAETFPRCQVDGQGDLLDVRVGEPIDIDVTW